MRILVDGRTFIKTSAGISTFLRCSLHEWSRKSPHDQFYVFIPKADYKLECVDFNTDNIHLVVCNGWKRIPNILFIFLLIPYYLRKLKIDLYYTPVPCLPFGIPKRVKKLIVVHDVVNLEFAQTMEFKNRLSNAFVFERSIKTADYIWTNSNYTKKCVQQYIPHRKCESIFVGCSIDDSLFYERSYTVDEQNVFLNKVGIDFPYILFVGTLEPRKNLKFLLEIAPAVFAKYGTKLVVVGAKGWKKTSVSDIVESSSYNQCAVHFCGYVSNEELVKLYHFARCFVSASLNEGFGMPQLEALKCGCPVITSHNSAMIEVAEDIEGAYTIKGYDAQQWITKIGDVISSNKQVSGNRISQYSWKTVLDNLIIYIS